MVVERKELLSLERGKSSEYVRNLSFRDCCLRLVGSQKDWLLTKDACTRGDIYSCHQTSSFAR